MVVDCVDCGFYGGVGVVWVVGDVCVDCWCVVVVGCVWCGVGVVVVIDFV